MKTRLLHEVKTSYNGLVFFSKYKCGLSKIFADIECRLNLVESATELFEDGGHAMAWCMKRI